ncbi:uncharacterized protein BcabD6B2_27180 [Babesia caballi]|uniref:Uncharacterized protein n=1 Tax=Babesia caballi TaxID=5871 RepID=A0AAV4LSZ9_BABCB|nr:hypothetical protein, conserved [Babesia caballi]
MFGLVQRRRRVGACLQHGVESAPEITHAVAKAMCTRMDGVLRINVLSDIPKFYPPACHELQEVKEVVLIDQLACVLLKSGLARCYDAVGAPAREVTHAQTDGSLRCELNPVDETKVHFAVQGRPCGGNGRWFCGEKSQSLKMGTLESPRYSYEFECVTLRHPAFFEFCGTNKRIGAADLCKHVYRFWNMNTYELVFEIKGQGYQEMRVSDGVVVMLSQPRNNFIPLSLYDIEDGTLLATRQIEIVHNRELQFLELLVTQLLIKQHGGPVRAYDILRGDGFTVEDTVHFRPSGFVFYDTPPKTSGDGSLMPPRHKLAYRPRRFFTISKNYIEFWELTRCHLHCTRQLFIRGMDNPDLCCHSLWANLLWVRACQQQPLGSDGGEGSADARRQRPPVRIRGPSLRKRNDRVHTPTKPGPGLTEVDIFAPNTDSRSEHGILLYSLDGLKYFGRIDREICGPRIRSLTVSSDLSTLACGNDSGIVRIMRMPNSLTNNHVQSPE